ncbi:MAG: hypothetical protein CVT95_13300 [Bacteroidetes bacterium HGW-Bacteroidetes-12]|jgi:hypothetical protein|nr:MAG: hypothetical protein CVT95_13300 [Bacteroidetes bacterium HGW-Bacteroidetes-12]
MATTKLTLTVSQETIVRAKEYAQQQGRSLSDLIENYLKLLTSDKTNIKTNLTPLTKSLKGSFSVPNDFDYKKELSDELTKKYS